MPTRTPLSANFFTEGATYPVGGSRDEDNTIIKYWHLNFFRFLDSEVI
jgi:hypothetical protein